MKANTLNKNILLHNILYNHTKQILFTNKNSKYKNISCFINKINILSTKKLNKIYFNKYNLYSNKIMDNSNNNKDDIQNLKDVSHMLRIHSIKMTDTSSSGHPTSCASIAEIISVLFFSSKGMKFFPKDPRNPANDRIILSKGHASPIYYAAWAEAGNFNKEQLMNLRKISSDLEGHPTPRLEFCDFATGSLGQGLANAAGCAYSSKYFDKNNNKVFCIVGDGESAEGSIWEAINFSGFYKLDNLIPIFDMNRLGQSDSTIYEHELKQFCDKLTSFGLKAVEIDGHNIEELLKVLDEARNHKGSPYAIVARTYKGKDIEGQENKIGFHGKPIKNAHVISSLEKKMNNKVPKFNTFEPDSNNLFKFNSLAKDQKYTLKTEDYGVNNINNKVSSRMAFGNALKKLGDLDGKDKTIIVGLDADVKNSTFTEYLYKAYQDKFINCYIAEQLMVSVAQGVCKTNKIPFVATFSTFFTRAFDQIRMGAISQDNVKYVGTHSGCHIGEDGPSQMGLEDIALFRSVPNMTVLVPSDPFSTERAVELAANTYGSFFIRTERNAHKTLYDSNEKFEVGRLKVLQQTNEDKICVISFGATLFECLNAAEELKKNKGISVRIIDIYSVKPIDVEGLNKNISECNNTAYVIEDHYYEGGVGEAVMSAVSKFGFKIHHKAVENVPRSGKPDELYELFKLNKKHILEDLLKIVQN